jgi:hypothetical protein
MTDNHCVCQNEIVNRTFCIQNLFTTSDCTLFGAGGGAYYARHKDNDDSYQDASQKVGPAWAGTRRHCSLNCNICRVGQNHIYTVYIRYFWQGNHQIYGHIRCIYTVLANPEYMQRPSTPSLWALKGSSLQPAHLTTHVSWCTRERRTDAWPHLTGHPNNTRHISLLACFGI